MFVNNRGPQPLGYLTVPPVKSAAALKCTINVMHLSHPETVPHPPSQAMENLSCTKPVPGAKNVGDCC